jgi:uncharacterized protein YaeQ
VINLPLPVTQALAKLAQRNMQLSCTIEDGAVWLSSDAETVQVEFVVLQAPV